MNDPLADPRRKRLLYRATHRGTKEADVIIGGFFQENAFVFPEERLEEAEAFLELPDLDLMDWIMGRKAIPEELCNSLLVNVIAWHRNKQGA